MLKRILNDGNILWVNPGFLDYRVALYSRLYELLNNRFFLIFGESRMPQRVTDKIKECMGENAIPVTTNRIIHLKGKGKKGISKSQSIGFANDSIEIVIPKRLYSLIKSVSPKCIIAEGFFKYTPWALAYSIIHRIPLFIYYERTAHTERNAPWWRKAYRKFISKFAAGFIVNGTETKNYLITQGVNEDKITTGGMCADSENLKVRISQFSIDDRIAFKSTIIDKSTNGLIYIYCGLLIKRKGVKELIDGWKLHILDYPNDTLLILGDGEQRESLERYTKKSDNIRFIGKIDYNEIYKYYAISDIFIIPTLEDNWSLVVPEAMACGLPIACSIYNGCHTDLVIDGENGTSFDPLSKNDVKRALDYFHNCDLQQHSKKSIEIENNYSPDNCAKNILNGISL